jgi:putative acetyltransferase
MLTGERATALPSARTTADGRHWVLRAAEPADAAGLASLFAAVRDEGRWLVTAPGVVTPAAEAFFIAELIREDGAGVLVADAGGTVVGNALVLVERDVASRHVATLSLAVDAGWREVGIGTALVQAAQDWVVGRGLGRLALSVFPDNARAIAVYTKAGFRREGLRRRQYRQPDGSYRDELLMAWLPGGVADDSGTAGWGTP